MNDATDTGDMSDLLDVTLDDIDDLPSFKPFPAGAHRVTATLEAKKIGDHPAVDLSLKLIETVEQADPQSEASAPGDEASTAFFMDNEIGLGKLKECAIAFSELAGSRVLREIVDAVTDIECLVVTGIRYDKKDTSKEYLDVKQIEVI